MAPSPCSTPIVDLSGVSLRIGVSMILRDVDLTVVPGEAIGMFGDNGVGKSTLLRLLATQLQPVDGTARIFGVDVATDARLDIRRRIGLIGHTPALHRELTIAENLEFAASLFGVGSAGTAEVLATVGLTAAADRPVAACSYGMQRRTEFARELMLGPGLLLLDEPHSALDVASSGLVDHLTESVTGRGGAAVLVSHDRERVSKLVDRTVEVVGGRIVEVTP